MMCEFWMTYRRVIWGVLRGWFGVMCGSLFAGVMTRFTIWRVLLRLVRTSVTLLAR